MQVTIDSREQSRIPIAKEYYKSKGLNVTVKELDTGDYLFNNKVVMEFKTWSDFMSSITDGRLWNETQKQMENYPIHFLVIHGTNRDYMEAFQHNGLDYKMITGAIARLNTYTKIIHGTRTLNETFELMRVTAEKCLDDKTLVRQFGTKSINRAFNVLCYTIDGIGGETARKIVNYYNLNTFSDVMSLTTEKLIKIDGIGEKTAKKIMEGIK